MDYLNKDLLRQFTPEELEAYRQSLEKRMADTAMFLLQVNEVIEERQ